MATRMLGLAQPHRQRFSLRINDDHRAFFYRMEAPTWVHCVDGLTMASQTAAIRFDQDGKRLRFSSVPGWPQVIILANTITNRAIGSIVVDDTGAITLKDTPLLQLAPIIPLYWTQKVVAIIGIDGAFTANLYDTIGEDEDIIRLKHGQPKLFRPARWVKPTDEYDVNGDNHINPGMIDPVDGPGNTTVTVDQQIQPSTSTGGLTNPIPVKKNEPNDDESSESSDNDQQSDEADSAPDDFQSVTSHVTALGHQRGG